jgi:hypothetical protein
MNTNTNTKPQPRTRVIVTHELDVCTDCIMFIANGDLTGLDYHYGEQADERKAEIIAGVESCLPGQVGAGDGEHDQEFSRYGCDCCGTPLAGARHRANVLGTVERAVQLDPSFARYSAAAERCEYPSFSFVGGYPLAYVGDGVVWCADCCNEVDRDPEQCGETEAVITAVGANWEDPDLYCDRCEERIPSAYAEPDDE